MICKDCQQPKDDDQFASEAKGGKLYRRRICRDCRAGYKRGRHSENLQSAASRRAQAMEYVDGLKRNPCTDCGQRWPPVAMDFDHVRGEKVDHVGVMVQKGYALEAIQAEIAKCELVCACCHRVRTALRGGWR